MTGDDQNRVPYVTIGVLTIVLVLGATLYENNKKEISIDPGVRAVVVPTAGATRTVVVAPCEAPVLITARDVAAGRPTPGVTALRLPPGRGVRTVVVPGCRLNNTGIGANLPSGAFVPENRTVPGTARPSEKPGKSGDPERAQSRVILPAGSTAQNVVLAPCSPSSPKITFAPSKAKRRPDVIPRPLPGAPNTVVAPPC